MLADDSVKLNCCSPARFASRNPVASPTGVRNSTLLKNRRRRHPRNLDISVSFFLKRINFCIFQYFQNKVAQIQGETKFLG